MISLALDQCCFFQRSSRIFSSCLIPSEWFCSFSIFALWSCPCSWEPLQVSGQSAMQSLLSSVTVWESQSPGIENVPGETREGGLFDGFVSLPLNGDDNVSNKDPQIPFLTLVTLKGPHFSQRPFGVPVTKAELRIQWVSTSLTDRLTEWLASPCHGFLALGWRSEGPGNQGPSRGTLLLLFGKSRCQHIKAPSRPAEERPPLPFLSTITMLGRLPNSFV